MLSIRCLVEGLGVFERNRVPLELKIWGWLSTFSFREAREVHVLLEPTHKTLHTILQLPKEANLSCHVRLIGL